MRGCAGAVESSDDVGEGNSRPMAGSPGRDGAKTWAIYAALRWYDGSRSPFAHVAMASSGLRYEPRLGAHVVGGATLNHVRLWVIWKLLLRVPRFQCCCPECLDFCDASTHRRQVQHLEVSLKQG